MNNTTHGRVKENFLVLLLVLLLFYLLLKSRVIIVLNTILLLQFSNRIILLPRGQNVRFIDSNS